MNRQSVQIRATAFFVVAMNLIGRLPLAVAWTLRRRYPLQVNGSRGLL
jgi:hypothetical protein